MNLILGPNGHGKTNLLDAISLGTQLKTIRIVKQSSDLILFGESQASVETRFENYQVSVLINIEGKKVKINNKPTRDSQALAQKISVVSFVPEDLGAVMGSAGLRRRLLDQITATLCPNYVLYYRQYEKVLLQRNRLLKQILVDQRELESFTEVLSQTAQIIEELRQKALLLIQPYFEEAFSKLSDSKLSSELSYSPVSGGNLRESLGKIKSEERARKTTLLGPHVDDLDMSLNNHPARFTASRGQARILILALKIAQLKSIFDHRSISPMLLLDDVVGELDPHHALKLLQVVDELKTQTFITTTDLDALPESWTQQNKKLLFI